MCHLQINISSLYLFLMKKILFFLFFLLFTGLLFMWDDGMTTFWKEGDHFSFLGQNFLSWIQKYSFVWEWILAYKSAILLFSVIWLLVTIPLYFHSKKKEKIRRNPLTLGKAVIDGNSILSAGSLPESEKKREKEKKVWPFMPKDVNTKKEVKPIKDVELSDMKTLLKKE